MKVVFATPTYTRPFAPYLEALERCVPAVKDVGWEEATVFEVGCPYISVARSKMTRKALDAGADVIVYLDHDVSWQPEDMLKLLATEGDVVAGTYRLKKDDEEYMGTIMSNFEGRPQVRPSDGAIRGEWMPAGFLKLTRAAIVKFMKGYPDLLYGDPTAYCVDLFNHGAHKGLWYGEDYAFCRNWRALGEEVWLVPDLNITHHSPTKAYPGNFHNFLRRQPGGDLCP